MHGAILTRFEHLVTVGLVRPGDLHKSVRRMRQALDAKKVVLSVDGETAIREPDHAIRLKAADQFCRLTDLYPKPAELLDSAKPVAVQIVLASTNGHAPTLPTGDGLTIHLNGH